jgi:hypothetical protein
MGCGDTRRYPCVFQALSLHPGDESMPEQVLEDAQTACRSLGGISRSTLLRILPELEVVHVNSRLMITRRSIYDYVDRLVKLDRDEKSRG